MVQAQENAQLNAPPTVTITTTSNTTEQPAFVPYFTIVPEEAPMPVDDFSQSRIKEFERRGFTCKFAIDAAEKIFSLFAKNSRLGQSFSFYFGSNAELVQWASANPDVKPKRIVRRFFEADGLSTLREDELDVLPGESIQDTLNRIVARKYRQHGDIEPAKEEPRELEFKRVLDLEP